ncbi:sulfatase [Vibrio sp. ABG19]|uniref:sulfatase family protein n=1 Tax=Vibrio sp. ABG19 TaxID=2817385 RepID=UPI00249E4058|nr:sulfatase [Vibrio sp. ABG19]WGY46251.1 sulfatase [Vibrio sp. ABG19]
MKNILVPSLITLAVSGQLYANEYTPQINSERPNIVIIIAEDMSSRIGAFGDEIATTPNLDALAKESVRFNQVYTMAGVSAPSRAGLITGAPQHKTGLQHMRTSKMKYAGVPPSYVKAYPELLRKNGYFTYNDIKTDYQFVNGAFDTGPFTIWDANGSAKNFNDFLVPSAWRQHDLQNKPFYINLNPMITHESGLFTPERTPEKFRAMQQLVEKIRAQYTYKTPDSSKIELPKYLVDSQQTRDEIARFYENIQIMDTQIGNVISDLKEDGLWDNTIFIFTTDHGDCLPRSKREGFVSGTHVPMIMHVPDKYKPDWMPENGEEVDRLVSFEDLAPTVLGYAGVESLPYMNGIDLSDDNPKEREYAFSDRARMDLADLRSYFVKDNDFQYVRNFSHNPNGATVEFRDYLSSVDDLNQGHKNGTLTADQEIWFTAKPDEELYDLNADPEQLNNLASDPKYKETLDRFRNVMDEWRNIGSDTNLIDEKTLIADLSSPDGTQKTTLPPVAELDKVTGKIFLTPRTGGASIGYSYDNKTWHVYNRSFLPNQSEKKLYIKAVRYGWKESEAVEFLL